MVYAYSLVEPELRPQRIYANQTSELVYNLSRDAARSQLASDLRLCAAILQPPPGDGGPQQRPAAQQGSGAGYPDQSVTGGPGDGSVVPLGRRLRQDTQRQPGSADSAAVPDPQAGSVAQDPAYLEWAAMHSGGAVAGSADVVDTPDAAGGNAEAQAAGGSDTADGQGSIEASPAGSDDSPNGADGATRAAAGGAELPSAAGIASGGASALDSTPHSSAGLGEQDPAYMEWAAMHDGAAGGAEATPAAASDSPGGAGVGGSAPDPTANSGAQGPAQQAWTDRNSVAVGTAPGSAAVSEVRSGASELDGVQDPAYLEWTKMRSGAGSPTAPSAPSADFAVDSSGNAPASHFGNDVQDPAYLEWMAMHNGAAGNVGSPAAVAGMTASTPQAALAIPPAADSVGIAPRSQTQAGTFGSPAAFAGPTAGTPRAAPATGSLGIAPSPQTRAGTGLQDLDYLAWLAMTGGSGVDASSPAAAPGPGSLLAVATTGSEVLSGLQGLPPQSTTPDEAQRPAADAPGVAAAAPAQGSLAPAQGSIAAAPAQSSSVPDPGGRGVDWTEYLTPSVLAAALQLSQKPFDPATWQQLLQSGAPLKLRLPLCHPMPSQWLGSVDCSGDLAFATCCKGSASELCFRPIWCLLSVNERASVTASVIARRCRSFKSTVCCTVSWRKRLPTGLVWLQSWGSRSWRKR